MEKATIEMINKFEKADKQAEIVILFDKDDKIGSEVVRNVSAAKGQYKVVHFMMYFGCEADIIVYVTNSAVLPEAISRPNRQLAVITGLDLHRYEHLLLKMAGATDHSYTSHGDLNCDENPCPWSGWWTPPVEHMSMVSHSVVSTWTPLLEHFVFCSNCEELIERRRGKCSVCGEKYTENRVFVRAEAKQLLELKFVDSGITDEEIETLVNNGTIVKMAQDWFTADDNDDKQQKATLWKQFFDLVATLAPSITRRSIKLVLEAFLSTIKETSDDEVEALLDNDDIVGMALQIETTVQNDEVFFNSQQSTLVNNLIELICEGLHNYNSQM